jgi:threonine aldolase
MALECLVAIHRDDCKTIKAWRKKTKGQKEKPSELIAGYKFVLDEEFDSLKIDFSKELTFEIRDLVNAK